MSRAVVDEDKVEEEGSFKRPNRRIWFMLKNAQKIPRNGLLTNLTNVNERILANLDSTMGKSSKRAAEAAAVAPSSDAVVAMEVEESTTIVEPKAKKAKKEEAEVKEIPKEAISAIAKPLAGKKLSKKILKIVKKGSLGRFFFLIGVYDRLQRAGLGCQWFKHLMQLYVILERSWCCLHTGQELRNRRFNKRMEKGCWRPGSAQYLHMTRT